MTSALDKLMAAIADEGNGRCFVSFSFRYAGFEFDYMGRYYAYVYEGDFTHTETEDEYGWKDYDDMLASVISQTGKTVHDMLSELPAQELEIEFDVPLPPAAIVIDNP
ncbi:MAG: hypothetical protein Q4G65_13880 [bacterium]|nr:hypothetical protein [bacterium]